MSNSAANLTLPLRSRHRGGGVGDGSKDENICFSGEGVVTMVWIDGV